jgi:hypothetical protein
VREALASLPCVEQESIDADVTSHEVTFTVTDPGKFDFNEVKDALRKQDFNEVELISAPKAKSAKKAP